MSARTIDLRRQLELRSRAVTTLSGDGRDAEAQLTASTAFSVLHTLASSPSTAGDALAVLHELQVHQVELDLQHEEMQRAGVELETSLVRQTQLYDHAPVALFSLDPNCRLAELNLATARLLGQERQALVGQSLPDFLAPDSRRTLNALLERARTAGEGMPQTAALAFRGEPSAIVTASISADPAGSGFLVAMTGNFDG